MTTTTFLPIPADVLESVPTEGNEFTLHYLFGLADYYGDRKVFRKVIRKICLEQEATHVIAKGFYFLSLPSGFIYKFSRDNKGTTFIELVYKPE